MSNNSEPEKLDIKYLHDHATIEITEEIEYAFVELVGKNISDGMSEDKARDRAIQMILRR